MVFIGAVNTTVSLQSDAAGFLPSSLIPQFSLLLDPKISVFIHLLNPINTQHSFRIAALVPPETPDLSGRVPGFC